VCFVTKSCGKQNLVKLFKKSLELLLLLLNLFVVFGLFSKSWIANNKENYKNRK